MRIGLDYDGTVTADPEAWCSFVKLMTERGHEVAITTWRYEDQAKNPEDNTPLLALAKKWGIKVIFCNRKAKRECWQANIWIDDNPDTVYRGQ